jgi:hypothetical protein
MRFFILLLLPVLYSTLLGAQVGSSLIGQSSPGIDSLRIPAIGKAEMQRCAYPGACSGMCAVYVFIGSGNWDEEVNWQLGIIPPAILNDCSEIIINPAGNTECVLNIPRQLLPNGSKITVMAGKRFRIPGEMHRQ